MCEAVLRKFSDSAALAIRVNWSNASGASAGHLHSVLSQCGPQAPAQVSTPAREPGSKAHIADAGQTQGGIICVRMPSAPGADVSASVRAYLARRPQKREYSRGSQII
jgi:hypothetical protein